MYYRLNDNYALRAWKFAPHGLYHRYTASPIRVDDETYELLRKCDGLTDLDDCDELRALAGAGVIEPCEKGELPCEWSRYREYGHRFVPAMNLMITGKCNYNCRHCFNAADNAEKMSEWDWDSLMDLFDQAAECGMHSITLTGGEPMLYPRFLDAVREIYRRGMVLEKLTTNGYFLTKEVLDEFRALRCDPLIKISFDGVGHHDWMRGHEGAEARTLEAMGLCVGEGFKVCAQTQVNRRTVDSVWDTVCLLDSMGVDKMRLIRTTPVPRWTKNEPDGTIPLPEYFGRMLGIADRYMHGDHNMAVLVWQFIRFFPKEKFYSMEDVISPCGTEHPTKPVCDGNRRMMAVTCEGDVTLCLQMSDYAKYFGYECENLGDKRLKDIITAGKWHDAVCTNQYALKKNGETCGGCKWFGHCGGGCRALAMLDSVERTGAIDYFAADPVACLFYKGGWYDKVRETLSYLDHP